MKFRELFEIRYSGRLLGVARTWRGHSRSYVGLVNGKIVTIAPAKGDLLRNLIQIAKTHPKAPDGVKTYFSYGK
jgi:hypothetical protein